MNVLILSPYSDYLMPIFEALEREGDTAQIVTKPLREIEAYVADFTVSYGYQHIIHEPWLTMWDKRLINLHIGYLPYNRGASPNLWSWYEGTPKGVTIHQIDRGIDTGPILFRRAVETSPYFSLRNSYDMLHAEMGRLFKDNWYALRAGKAMPYVQLEAGTYHSKAQTENLLKRFPRGWETPCDDVRKMGVEDGITA